MFVKNFVNYSDLLEQINNAFVIFQYHNFTDFYNDLP